MKRLITSLVAVALLGFCLVTPSALAQDYNNRDYNEPDYNNDDYYDRGSIDRYLDVEVWTDHADADYYTGDEVVIHFRANRDAFVAIYSIDSRGMVNLLFPSDPAQDNYILGGVTYALPGADDDYDLVLNGPEGTEHIQIIASRERFPIPDWYHNSGLVLQGDDANDYMDWLNGRYFVRYSGQRFAYDRAVIFVNEWEPTYFRPVYYPDYPSWAVVGNVYIDYPWGSTVYINGYYWGVTPLYIPRILVGWHTLTIYDRYGYCWENDFHVSRYHTVVFDRTVVSPSPQFRSKFTKVRTVGYRDPVTNGYSNYNKVVASMQSKTVTSGSSSRGTKIVKGSAASERNVDDNFSTGSKRYVRGGETKLVKTDRGFETSGAAREKSGEHGSYDSYKSSRSRGQTSGSSDSYSSDYSRSSTKSKGSSSVSGSGSSGTSGSSTSGDYYKRKSGSTDSGSSRSGSASTKTYRSKEKTSSGSSSSTSKSPTVTKSKQPESQPKAPSKSSTSKVSKGSSSKKSPSSSSSTSKGSSSKSSSSKSSSSSSSSKGKTKR